jgi:hypothetical protein
VQVGESRNFREVGHVLAPLDPTVEGESLEIRNRNWPIENRPSLHCVEVQ